jgi:hypothetical protein
MRYIQPRPAQKSKEKQKEREDNMQPFSLQKPVIIFEHGKKKSYLGNIPLNKQIDKKSKAYFERGKA